MENASKALIIAGSILITIIVISLGIMVFRNMAGSVQNEANLDKQKIQAFNSKIQPYIGDGISASQVNNLINLARSIDQKAIQNEDTIQVVTIKKSSGELVVGIVNNKVETNRVETGKYYNVSGEYVNGLLSNITISE